MLAKLATLAQSKTAVAVLGVVLVGGGSGAVAVAATTGHLNTLGISLNSAEQTKTPDSAETPDAHAKTVGVEGVLTACSTTGNTISVKDKAGKSWSFVIVTTGTNATKFNGDLTSSDHGTSTAQGDNSTHAGGASTGGASTGDNSTHEGGASTGGASTHEGGASTGGASTHEGGDNSAHAAWTLADVCKYVNLRDVEVQATPKGTEYDAWKVTVQGSDSATNDGASSESNGSASGSDSKGGSSDSNGGASTGSNTSESSQATAEPKVTVTPDH